STSATTAANSATAAGNSATAAANSASNASTYATNAETASTASNTAKVAAESARDAASGSATAAATSASTASTKATEAGQSANTASTKATEANTSAASALTYRNQASTSATNAAASALAAATDYTAVNARLNNAGGTGVTVEQSLTATASSITGLEGKYTVKVDNYGYVSGFGLASTNNNGTPTAEFIILADRFSIISPGKPKIVPFIVSGDNVVINSAFINTLDATKISSTSLSSINSNMGTITAGKMQSADGKFVIDLTNKFIRIEV
ncbi:MAG: DUF1983 domain-containing protein, partial [Betaproteobacteria bacterium]|nr:DUF1983 domain-containing protein [Betaproteobacteria bacterium]